MVLHKFKCYYCDITIKDYNKEIIHKCPNCNRKMRWDCGPSVRGNYKHPVHSDALAINPDQRAEHEQLFPDIRLDGQCRPIFDNFRDHENYLKKTGFVKHRKKIKPKRKKIRVDS